MRKSKRRSGNSKIARKSSAVPADEAIEPRRVCFGYRGEVVELFWRRGMGRTTRMRMEELEKYRVYSWYEIEL